MQTDLFTNPEAEPLTVLSYGGGQDSTVILDRMIGELDAVVFADTGNEHDHTYSTVRTAQAFCQDHGVPFFWLTPGSRFHSTAWQSLTGQWQRNQTIGMARGKACSDNLKIKPIYRWLNSWAAELLGIPCEDYGKPAIRALATERGRIRMIIGIAKGEEKRLGGEFPQSWARESIERIYPLITWGMDREACQEYLNNRAEVWGRVYPSNCLFCHFQSPQELLWLARQHPAAFERWTRYEARKIADNTDKPKNHGVYGAKLLPVKLLDAEEKHGHLTDAELDAYKFGHGHTATTY